MSNGTTDVLIKGGTVASGAGLVKADIAVRDGRIVELSAEADPQRARRVIDAAGKLVLPGVVDAHNHCYPIYSDDVRALSISAAFGGVTTIIPFIGVFRGWGGQPLSLLDTVDTFIEEGHKKSVVDFGLHAVITGDTDPIPQIPRAIEKGVLSFKFFMAYKKRGMMLTDEQILPAMETIADCGALAMVHCENGGGIDYLETKFMAQGQVTNDMYLKAHTDLLEAEAVFRAIALADAVRCPLYIVHLAVKEGLEVIARFKYELPQPLFAETCPHYLLLTNDEVLKRGPLAKIGPPIRERHDNEALWQGIRAGVIDVVATDHAGYTQELKHQCQHILDARYGAPGVGTLLPLLYSEGVRRGRIDLPRMVQVLCERPAQIFGLYPQKGTLQPGSDADLVIFDPNARYTISYRTQHTVSDYCLYEGWECVGRPALVMQRGEVLVEGGELKAQPGQGRFLPARSAFWQKAAQA